MGIVGLPNVGKSTLFKSLTKKSVEIAPRPFTTISPNIGMVPVPDQRLERVAEVIGPEKITPTVIEFVDIAGLVKGAHQGEGLGNQFLAQIRNCDSILEVVRLFDNPGVENVLGEINPEKEIEIVKVELLMKDLETLEGSIAKLEKKGDRKDSKKIITLKKLKEAVSRGQIISELALDQEEILEIKEYQFLTAKPVLKVFNTNGKIGAAGFGLKYLQINLKDEEEAEELSEEEKKELGLVSKMEKLITACYDILNLITFFTVAGGKEVRAWTLKRGATAPEAGGVVHTDFQKKFIRAEVIDWKQLLESGSWTKARELGLIKTAGKDHIVQDGEVIEFKI